MVEVNGILNWIWAKLVWFELFLANWMSPFLVSKGLSVLVTPAAWLLAILIIWIAIKFILAILFK